MRRNRLVCFALALFLWPSTTSPAQPKVPPYDLWADDVLARIRDPKTLEYSITPRLLYFDVFFTSNPSASYFDSTPPYAEHTNERITIHGYLATPLVGGPYPAIVIGHGHGGKADATVAQLVASLGYVALYIDGPRAGQSTGGPADDNQAWISVDKGPEYGYLYHYGYAGMRALTLLEELGRLPLNPFRIDSGRLGALGASMGGIFTTYLNGIDTRMKAAVIMASAGSWAHTLRYPNSWLYHGIYAGTRYRPYSGGEEPINAISDIDRDPTAINFMNYFDPIRYAPRQHAPVLTLIGTHDQYFPLPNANLMLQAISSSGRQANFEKRLWLIPNAPHGFDQAADLLTLTSGIKEFLDYAFKGRAKPLATPRVSVSSGGPGLRFEVSLAEASGRLAGAKSTLYAATRIDSTASPIRDFKSYVMERQGDRFVCVLPPGETSGAGDRFAPENVIYYATVTDSGGLPVSSLVYKGLLPMDLSTDFTPVIDPFGGGQTSVPLPPSSPDAAESVFGSHPLGANDGYQGIAISNPAAGARAVRLEARSVEGRIAAGEGLVNPVYLSLPPRTQKVFVNEEWFGPGAQSFGGSLHAVWTDSPPASLAFRGASSPAQLDGIGPLAAPAKNLWLPMAPEQDEGATRHIHLFGGSADADVVVVFRSGSGSESEIPPVHLKVIARGNTEIIPPPSPEGLVPASAEIQSSAPISARLEVDAGRDPWSVEARPVASATRYFQPYAEWNSAVTTRLIVLNPSALPRQIRLHLRRRDGTEIGAASTRSMAPYAVSGGTVESLFPAVGGIAGAGWLEVEALDGPVVATALAVDRKSGAAAASSLEGPASGTWSMPFYVETAGYWTGIAVANVGNNAADLLIRAIDRAGSVRAEGSIRLNPLQSSAQLVYQWIRGLPPGTTGHITVEISGTASLLAYFGTEDGAALAAIPFTSIADRPPAP